MKKILMTIAAPVLAVLSLNSVGLAAAPANHAAPVTDLVWKIGANIPRSHIESAGTVAHGNKLFVISGAPGDCTDGSAKPPTKAVDIYFWPTNKWTSGPSVNFARDQEPLAATVANKIFLIGGTTGCGGTTVRTVEELNLAKMKWSALPSSSDLPASLTGNNHCGVAVGKKIYYFQDAGIGVFNTSTLTWSVLPASPLLSPSLFCKASVVRPNRIMITGPGNGSADSHSQRVLMFDPSAGTLTQLSISTVPLAEHAMGTIHHTVVVAGGDFSPTSVQTITGNVIATASPMPFRHDAVAGVADDDHMIVAGGVSDTSTTPPVLIGMPVHT